MQPINDKLKAIIFAKTKQLEIEKQILPVEKLEKILPGKFDAHNCFYESIFKSERLNIIAEYKKASPSEGHINLIRTPIEAAQEYESGGASAISVLTEQNYFLGSDEDLSLIIYGTNLPVLRKDFILDEYDIIKTAALRADAILLICTILPPDKLKSFYLLARSLNLEVLVEVHSREELDLALKLDADIIGINNRNLATFEVDIHTTEKLINFIPKGKIKVSESGIHTPDDALFVKNLGADAALIGTAFSKSRAPALILKEFRV